MKATETRGSAIISLTGNLSTIGDWYELTVENSLRWGYEGWGGHILVRRRVY